MLVKAKQCLYQCSSATRFLTFPYLMLLHCLWFATFHPAAEEQRLSGEGRKSMSGFALQWIKLQSLEWAERWFDSSVGKWGPQAAEQLYHFLCFLLLYHSGQLCLSHGLYHVFPFECYPLVGCTLTQDGICCEFESDESSEGGLWLPEQSSLKHPTATSIQCVAQGHSCQMS